MESIGKNVAKKLMLSNSSYNDIGNVLLDLIKKTNSKIAIFADIDGYPIVHRGQVDDIQISAITALAASSFSATAEMAKMLGEKDRFQYLYHEGERANLYLCTVKEGYFLIVAFDSSVALGMIRIFTNLTVTKLNNMLQELKIEGKETVEFLNQEFSSLLSEELNKSFNLD